MSKHYLYKSPSQGALQIKLIAPKIEAAPERCKLKILGIDEFSLLKIKLKQFFYFYIEKAPPQNSTSASQRIKLLSP